MQLSTAVPFGNTFVLVGGSINGKVSDMVIKYNPSSQDWEELPGKLREKRSSVAAMLIPSDATPGCTQTN